MNYLTYFTYDESSPSCLVWNNPNPQGRGKGNRKHGKPVGSKAIDGWRCQVIDNGERYRFSASRAVWQLHHGFNSIPEGHFVCTKNGDLFDVRIDNLVCVSGSEMQLFSAWKRGVENVQKLPSGSFAVQLDDVHYGTYKTYETAAKVYREELYKRVKHLL